MSAPPKKGFAAFIRPPMPGSLPAAEDAEPAAVTTMSVPRPIEQPPERTRHITSSGRVRTHTANRMLPGVTLRLSEERWERLKMLSIQERRPIQDILGEALDAYMKRRGLPW
jgi:hypothetical protein